MFRQFIAFLFCSSLVSCEKASPSVGVIEQSFDITKENDDGLNAIKSLAYEAKAWSESKEASKKMGWKAVATKGAVIPVAPSFKNVNEELEYYGSVIFQNLGYPLEESPGSSFSVKTNKVVNIRHRKEALAQFEELLKRWRRSPNERFNDMLHGRK